MDIQPAHLSQIQRASDGRMIEIDGDVGGVVQDLKNIDPGLGVRFAEAGHPPYWHVYHQSEDGRETRLVFSQQAHQTASGMWTGLDQRIVKRIMEIGHSSYDFEKEVVKKNAQARATKDAKFRYLVEENGDRAAWAVRKDLGGKSRAAFPKTPKKPKPS